MSRQNLFRFSLQTLGRYSAFQSSLRAIVILGILASLLSVTNVPQVQAQPNLTITPITWNIIGLDSNNVNVGPNNFPVGARVCNTGDEPATNVAATFVWDSSDPYINLRSGSLGTLSVPSLAAGQCTDFYFEVSVTRNSAAYNHTRRYHIEVTADGGISISTPQPRELFVEYLVSQNRNATVDVRLNGESIPPGGMMGLVVGQTYTITLVAFTATNGYEQIETFINFPNTIFRINSVQTAYTAHDTVSPDPWASTKLYADGCTWENDPNSPNYRSCLGTGKYGGNVTITYTVTIIGGAGTQERLHTLIYDLSGSSYHYNADYAANYRIAAILDLTSITISKNFSPDPVYVGGVSRLTFTISNPNPAPFSSISFTDTLPSPLVIAAPPNVGFSGCGSPTVTAITGTTTITATNITVGASGSCVIGINVTSPSTGTYTNTTGSLYVGTTNTGRVATDTLTVNADPPPPLPPTTCATPADLARWSFENYTASTSTQNGPFNASYRASDISSAQGVYGAYGASTSGIANPTTCPTGWACPSSNNGNTGNSWGIRGGWPNTWTGPDSSPYFQFEVHGASAYGGIGITMTYNLEGNWSNRGPWYIYFSTDGTNWSQVATGTWTANPSQWRTGIAATTTSTGNDSVYFRIFFAGAQRGTAVAYLDNIRIFGCERLNLAPPTLVKSFSPNPIGVGGTSTLAFTLSHTNPVTMTGATFSDFLPAGLQVASPPNLTNTCGGTVSGAVAGSTAITLTGGTIPPNGSCTLRVNVIATTAGPHLNVTSFISTTETGVNTGPTGLGSDTLVALAPPTIEKLFTPNPIVSGTTTTLIFDIINPNVDYPLTSVAFTDTFPSGVVVATPPNASTSGCGTPTFNPIAGTGSISFSGGTIAPGGTCTARVDVTAPAGVYTNTTGPVTANITSGTDVATDTLTVRQPNPGLAFQKQIATSASGPWRNFVAVTVGQGVYYRFVVENTGDIPLTNVSVSDPDLNLSACSWQDGDGNPLTAPFTLPVADLDEEHIAYCVLGPVTAQAGQHTNTATADSTETGPVTDTATYATVGLTLEKRAEPDYFVNAGEVLTYTYVVTNTGYAPLQGPVVVTDTLTTVTCPDVTTVIPDGDNFLDPGEAITCTATYTVTADDVSAGYVTNVARTTVEGLASNEDSATVPASTSADLSLEKVASTLTPYVGSTVVFTITVHNAGPAVATGVTVSDFLPAGLTYVSHSGDGLYDPGTGVWNIGTISAGNSASLLITVTVDTTAPVTNVAQVWTSDQTDPDSTPGNNVPTEDDYDSVTLTPRAYPEITVAKTAEPGSVPETGGVVTFTFTVTNTGTVSVTITDLSDSVFGTLSGDADCGVGTVLQPGQACSFTHTATLSGPANTTHTNTFTAEAEDAESNTASDSDSAWVDFLPVPGLVVEKSVATGQAVQSMPFTYTVRITNTGQVTFDPLVLTDTLPADFYYVVGSGDPSDPDVIAEPLLVWQNLGPLGPGESITVTFAVTATPGITGTYWNVALVGGEYPGGVLTDTDDAPVAIVDPAVVVDKQLVAADLDDVFPNYVTFTIAITNVGISTIDVLPLLDAYDPYYLSFFWAEPYPEEDADDGLLTWHDLTGPAPNGFGRDLAPGESFRITTVFRVVHDITTTVNTAYVEGPYDVYDNPANEPQDDEVIVDIPTAVELLYFVGRVDNPPHVRLEWATAVEIDTFGFRLYRAPVADFARAQAVAFVPSEARGGGATYVYTDTVPYDGTWWYWLADVDTSGGETVHGPVSAVVGAAALPYRVYLPLVLR